MAIEKLFGGIRDGIKRFTSSSPAEVRAETGNEVTRPQNEALLLLSTLLLTDQLPYELYRCIDLHRLLTPLNLQITENEGTRLKEGSNADLVTFMQTGKSNRYEVKEALLVVHGDDILDLFAKVRKGKNPHYGEIISQLLTGSDIDLRLPVEQEKIAEWGKDLANSSINIFHKSSRIKRYEKGDSWRVDIYPDTVLDPWANNYKYDLYFAPTWSQGHLQPIIRIESNIYPDSGLSHVNYNIAGVDDYENEEPITFFSVGISSRKDFMTKKQQKLDTRSNPTVNPYDAEDGAPISASVPVKFRTHPMPTDLQPTHFIPVRNKIQDIKFNEQGLALPAIGGQWLEYMQNGQPQLAYTIFWKDLLYNAPYQLTIDPIIHLTPEIVKIYNQPIHFGEGLGVDDPDATNFLKEVLRTIRKGIRHKGIDQTDPKTEEIRAIMHGEKLFFGNDLSQQLIKSRSDNNMKQWEIDIAKELLVMLISDPKKFIIQGNLFGFGRYIKNWHLFAGVVDNIQTKKEIDQQKKDRLESNSRLRHVMSDTIGLVMNEFRMAYKDNQMIQSSQNDLELILTCLELN